MRLGETLGLQWPESDFDGRSDAMGFPFGPRSG